MCLVYMAVSYTHLDVYKRQRKYNTWLKLGDFMIELQTPKVGDKFDKWSNLNSGPVHMGFLVENVEHEYERIKNLGYTDFKVKN